MRDAAASIADAAADSGKVEPPGAELDLLFVVDDSSSMREEQAALRREFPRLIRKLVSGDHDADGKREHAAFTSLHIGVVSSDMGADDRIRGCEDLGDDGVLRSAANLAHDTGLSCEGSYPSFLEYSGPASALDPLAREFACIAALGTNGCGFEQHLESALKALWPASRPELSFLGDGPVVTSGRGDRDNAGFLRGSASTLAVLVVADEDDCSSADRAIFQPEAKPDNPYQAQPLNLRCHYNHDKAFPLERYLYGLQHLGSRRVLFAGLVGVPVDAVDAKAQRELDYGDDGARDAFYQKLLDDPRMQETLDGQSAANSRAPMELNPVCTSALGRAYPARRLVGLAQRFGRDGLIRSVCADFAGALDQLADRLAARLD
jgi:hypothetical protein